MGHVWCMMKWVVVVARGEGEFLLTEGDALRFICSIVTIFVSIAHKIPRYALSIAALKGVCMTAYKKKQIKFKFSVPKHIRLKIDQLRAFTTYQCSEHYTWPTFSYNHILHWCNASMDRESDILSCCYILSLARRPSWSPAVHCHLAVRPLLFDSVFVVPL